MIKRFSTLLILMLILGTAWVRTASAQKATPSDDDVNAIARQLYCPVCENTPLEVCPTQACHDWRELIRTMLADGKSPDAIKQYFVDHYGARVLPEPPARGFNLGLYVVWPALGLAGAFLIFQAFRLWKRQKPPQENASVTEPKLDQNDDYVHQLEEELRKRK